jgi:hypothetical protein
MQIKHKLSPAVQGFAQTTLKELNELRTQYLAALGAAKEIELRSQTLQQALSQQLALVQAAEGLPQPIEPYRLSPDCSMMIGEIADLPAAADPEPVGLSSGSVNGANNG